MPTCPAHIADDDHGGPDVITRLRAHHMVTRRLNAYGARPARAKRCARRHAAIVVALLASSLTAARDAESQTRSGTDSATSAAGLATPGAIARDARSFARRVGLWGSAGIGRASAGLSCAACQSDQSAAFSGTLAIGGRVRPRFHVGVETWAWLDVIGNGVDRMARGTQLIARHYPLRNREMHITGGAGTSRFTVDDGDTRFDASSPALSLGLGWDVPYRGVILSPTLSIVASTGGPLTSSRTGNSVAENARLGLWRSTLSITWF